MFVRLNTGESLSLCFENTPVESQAPRHSVASELVGNSSAVWKKCQYLLGQASGSEQVL